MPQIKIAEHITFRTQAEKPSELLHRLIEKHALHFDSLLRRYFLLYMGAACFLIICIFFFIAAVLGFIPPYIGAFTLGILGLISCASFIGHRYLSLHKPERFISLIASFGEASCNTIPYQQEIQNSHLFLASAYILFSEYLGGRASTYFYFPYLPMIKSFTFLSQLCHSHDIHTLRELLLKEALMQQLELVQCDPLNLTYHCQLANTYILLSRLFQNTEISTANQESFCEYTAQAAAEFQIIAAYAPNDLWVHAQLAICYRDLQQMEEEARVCETMLGICPNDSESLLRLGILYFQLGNNAKGLHVYKQLLQANWKLAEQLIIHYGNSK